MSQASTRRRLRASPYVRTMKAIKAFDLQEMSHLFFRYYPNIREWMTKHSFDMRSNPNRDEYVRASVHQAPTINSPVLKDYMSFAKIRVYKDDDKKISAFKAEVHLCIKDDVVILKREWRLDELLTPHCHMESGWYCEHIPDYHAYTTDWTTAIAHLYRHHLHDGDRDKLLIDFVEHYMKVISIYVRGSPSLGVLQSMRLL